MTREEMLHRLKKTLTPQRYAHTLGVEETAVRMARALCETDLDAAMRMALQSSAEHVKENRQALHPDTQKALQALTRQEGPNG